MTYSTNTQQSSAELRETVFIASDGASLPLRHWLPSEEPEAIVVAIHGFNDYSHAFERPGQFFSQHGIACYAYDQRGFGASPKRGRWAGNGLYREDLLNLAKLLRQRFPQKPIYLLGESMGGAVAMTAIKQATPGLVSGLVLVAPAIWARSTMPWYQTSLLWTLAHTVPWITLTGQSLGVQASDNIDMLRALGRDPWVIKGTKVESIYGLANLMDEAFGSADSLNAHTLLLYGEQDQIIPQKPTLVFLQNWLKHDEDHKTVAFYKQGYHMLLRDLHAELPLQDIVTWIKTRASKLPSGADKYAKQLLANQGNEVLASKNTATN